MIALVKVGTSNPYTPRNMTVQFLCNGVNASDKYYKDICANDYLSDLGPEVN